MAKINLVVKWIESSGDKIRHSVFWVRRLWENMVLHFYSIRGIGTCLDLRALGWWSIAARVLELNTPFPPLSALYGDWFHDFKCGITAFFFNFSTLISPNEKYWQTKMSKVSSQKGTILRSLFVHWFRIRCYLIRFKTVHIYLLVNNNLLPFFRFFFQLHSQHSIVCDINLRWFVSTYRTEQNKSVQNEIKKKRKKIRINWIFWSAIKRNSNYWKELSKIRFVYYKMIQYWNECITLRFG